MPAKRGDDRQPEVAREIGCLIESALAPPRGVKRNRYGGVGAAEIISVPRSRISAPSGAASDRRPSYFSA